VKGRSGYIAGRPVLKEPLHHLVLSTRRVEAAVTEGDAKVPLMELAKVPLEIDQRLLGRGRVPVVHGLPHGLGIGIDIVEAQTGFSTRRSQDPRRTSITNEVIDILTVGARIVVIVVRVLVSWKKTKLTVII
jgi:hypothetical protein